jgi:hypothetical protein
MVTVWLSGKGFPIATTYSPTPAREESPEFYDAISALARLYEKQEFWRKAVEMWKLALAATKDEDVRANLKAHLLSLL